MDNNTPANPWSTLTKKDKINLAIGWGTLILTGVVCYKAGKHYGENPRYPHS